jgi:hypothetical protein
MDKKGKIALLFTTRNCYQLFDNIFFKNTTQDFSNCHIFNIDMNSNKEQKDLAEKVFEKYNITNLPTDSEDKNIYSIQRDIELCNQHIDENDLDIDWILWCSHDGRLKSEDFLEQLQSKIDDNPRFNNEVGIIGFCDYGNIEEGKPCYGRGDLLEGLPETGKGWYQNLPEEYKKSEYFIVEGAHDNYVLVNRHLYKEHIVPDYNFILFTVWDEISAQFNLKNIASITIPSLEVVDLYREKSNFGLSRSLHADKSTHMDSWKDQKYVKWWIEKYKYPRGFSSYTPDKFPYDDSIYKNSIQEKLFNWHVDDGPKTLDDLREHS